MQDWEAYALLVRTLAAGASLWIAGLLLANQPQRLFSWRDRWPNWPEVMALLVLVVGNGSFWLYVHYIVSR